jgi:carbonic anhydrase/acetyltransferase-like protein (isoleucine patch superfamily)
MLLEHNGAAPKIDPSARIAPNAVICGDVTVGANSSIGFGAVLTAESGPITVGCSCVIMDTATIQRGLVDFHVLAGMPCTPAKRGCVP